MALVAADAGSMGDNITNAEASIDFLKTLRLDKSKKRASHEEDIIAMSDKETLVQNVRKLMMIRNTKVTKETWTVPLVVMMIHDS